MDNSLAVYEAQLPAITGEFNRLPGGPIKPEVLSRPTPPTQRKYLAITETKGYYYIEGSYCIECLNEAYGPGSWWHEITSTQMQEPMENGEVEVVVSLRLFVPGGPVRGIQGLGSDKYRPNNKADSLANTVLSAETRALKRAARFLGIGLDVNENPNEGAAIEAQQKTIEALAKTMIDKGQGDRVVELFRQHATQAVGDDGELRTGLLTEHQLDPLKKAILAEMRTVKTNAK